MQQQPGGCCSQPTAGHHTHAAPPCCTEKSRPQPKTHPCRAQARWSTCRSWRTTCWGAACCTCWVSVCALARARVCLFACGCLPRDTSSSRAHRQGNAACCAVGGRAPRPRTSAVCAASATACVPRRACGVLAALAACRCVQPQAGAAQRRGRDVPGADRGSREHRAAEGCARLAGARLRCATGLGRQRAPVPALALTQLQHTLCVR
jgi:hypothetical protein